MVTLYKNKLIYDTTKWQPPSLKKLIALCKTPCTSWGLYVFLVGDRSDNNPIKDIPEETRPTIAAKLAFSGTVPDSKEKKALAVKAIKEYKEHYYDRMQADIDLYDKKMIQFIDLLDDTEPVIRKNTHEKSGKISFTTNVDIITSTLENIMKVITDKAIVTGLLKSGNSMAGLRGSLSPNIKGKLKTK